MRRGAGLVLLFAMIACRDATREPGGGLAADREALDGVVAADLDLDQTVKRADDQAAAGDGAGAAVILERDAVPKAEVALERARGASVATPWGVACRDEWVGLLTDRRAELPRYAAALRGPDLDVKLAAMQAQVELQKRAMAAALTVSQGSP